MEYCSSCGSKLNNGAIFCGSCGEEVSFLEHSSVTERKSVPLKSNATSFVMVLCILTLVGSTLGLFRGLFYQAVADSFGNGLDYHRGWMLALANIGTIVGAIIMMNKSKVGLLVYTIFQVIYLAIVILTSFVYVQDEDLIGFTIIIAMFFLIPSIAFLVMYWLPQNRDSLT